MLSCFLVYYPTQTSPFGGTYRVNSQRAIRATTAAPMFFTPVRYEGGVYVDGAVVANNPANVAHLEAKVSPRSSYIVLIIIAKILIIIY